MAENLKAWITCLEEALIPPELREPEKSIPVSDALRSLEAEYKSGSGEWEALRTRWRSDLAAVRRLNQDVRKAEGRYKAIAQEVADLKRALEDAEAKAIRSSKKMDDPGYRFPNVVPSILLLALNVLKSIQRSERKFGKEVIKIGISKALAFAVERNFSFVEMNMQSNLRVTQVVPKNVVDPESGIQVRLAMPCILTLRDRRTKKASTRTEMHEVDILVTLTLNAAHGVGGEKRLYSALLARPIEVDGIVLKRKL